MEARPFLRFHSDNPCTWAVAMQTYQGVTHHTYYHISHCIEIHTSITYIYIYSTYIHTYIYIYIISPLKFTPRGRGHHFVVIKRGVLEKAYKMIGFQEFFVPTKCWGRVHQPPLFNTPPFCTEVYLARMFDLVFFLSMNFACMLGPCAPKKAPFCKNLFLYHLPSFFSSVIKEQPILFVRKWAQ